jgi:SAM-dependent methyltransferase
MDQASDEVVARAHPLSRMNSSDQNKPGLSPVTSAREITAKDAGDSTHALGDILREQDYLRRRLQPHWSEWECLIHEDLRDAVLFLCRDLRGRLLDFGCGGSPYKGLLPQFSPYVRADITAGEGIDLVLDSRGSLPGEPAASYDVVLSTQVLEHVPDPARYLTEAHRLLRPGGALVLTTHGFFQEHGCPYDYYRWTGYGLERAVEDAGFVVEESYKLTVGLRAVIYFLHFSAHFQLNCPEWPLGNFFLQLAGRIYRRFLVGPLNRLGQMAKEQARTSSHSVKDSLYLGVALRARKPGVSDGAPGLGSR